MKSKQVGKVLCSTVLLVLFLCAVAHAANPPICPHIIYWNSSHTTWAQGAPWIKVILRADIVPAKNTGAKVFYRPYEIPGNDGGECTDGIGMANAVLDLLSQIPREKWPDAIGYRNEFGGGDTTTTQQFIHYYDRLRAGYNGIPGYTGMIVFGSYSTGAPESYRWSQTDVKNAVNKADAIETHEYFDLTEAFCHSWLMCRHVRFINENPYLLGKPWFIGEAGSDRIGGSCHEDPCSRRGWQYVDCGAQKLSESQYINELATYRSLCANQVVAVFLFQQGSPYWADFEVVGTSVADWMKTTWATGTISGNVKNTSGQNLQGASVTTSPDNYSTSTDSNGNYAIYLPAKTYDVTASKSGYQSNTQTGKTVNPNQTTTVNFTLSPLPPGTLAGNVKNTNGQNLQDATVTVLPGGASANTDQNGNYTIGSLLPGDYTATASKAGYIDSSSGVTIASGQTTTENFTLCSLGVELLTNGNFSNGCTGWSRSNSPSNIYWGCGNKVYPYTWSGAGGHSWNAYLSCGGYWCDQAFTGEQHQDNVTVAGGACYLASAQVYYEPVLHANDPSDQKERIVLVFNDAGATTHTSAWHTHTTSNGWDKIMLSGAVPTGATRMTFKVELSHTDYQWSGTGAVDECSFLSHVTGTITGYVRDTGSNPLSGATVATTTGGYSTTSQANGSYTLSNVTPNTYTVRASKSGYVTQDVSNVVVTAGGTATASFNLSDATAPSTPVVTDDGAYTTSTTQLHASWSATDPESGVTEYKYAIGTTQDGTNVVGWTSVGTSTSVTKTGLSLAYDQTYYFSVQAKNRDNLWSASGYSNGIKVARSLASISGAKGYPDGSAVGLSGKVVTAATSTVFWIQEADRSSGIKAVASNTLSVGSSVNVAGVLATTNAERRLDSAEYTVQL